MYSRGSLARDLAEQSAWQSAGEAVAEGAWPQCSYCINHDPCSVCVQAYLDSLAD